MSNNTTASPEPTTNGEKPAKNGEDGYLISALQKAGIQSYKEAFETGKLKYTTVQLYIPTGIVPVDHILGGGFPAGRITEIYGPEAVYKSGLSQMALECCLYMGGVGLFYDNEETFDETRSVLPSFPGFIYDISNSIEDFFKSIKKNLEIVTSLKNAISVALWDSIPATLPKQILESDEGERTLGEAARIMSIEIPRCKALIRESLCAFIAVNQVRANINQTNKYDKYENPYHTPGGNAPKFFATLRLMLQKRGKFTWYADSIETNGVYIEVLVEKNKNFNPFQRAIFPIVYQDKRGGDPAIAYFDWATNLEEITVAGAGRWNFGPIIPDLKCHKTEFHHAYLENLDVFLDFYYGKTGFKYGDLARIGVKAITERLYAQTTEITRGPKKVRPK